MSLCKAFGLGIFTVVCLLGETTGSLHAQCNSFLSYCATELEPRQSHQLKAT